MLSRKRCCMLFKCAHPALMAAGGHALVLLTPRGSALSGRCGPSDGWACWVAAALWGPEGSAGGWGVARPHLSPVRLHSILRWWRTRSSHQTRGVAQQTGAFPSTLVIFHPPYREAISEQPLVVFFLVFVCFVLNALLPLPFAHSMKRLIVGEPHFQRSLASVIFFDCTRCQWMMSWLQTTCYVTWNL